MSEVGSDPFQRPWAGAPAVLALDAVPRPPRRTRDGRLVGPAVRPSAGVRVAYDARLRRLVDEMHASMIHWLGAAYRRDVDRITAPSDLDAPGGARRSVGADIRGVEGARRESTSVFDARPSTDLDEVIRRLRRRWLGRFDEESQALARWFAAAVHRRNDTELRSILRRAGISVEFKLSRAARDALGAIVRENVALIRSIPEQYLSQVEASVMRSVAAGRDLASLTADLRQHHGVVRRRAELIALHQNNMASSHIARLQFLDVGISTAIWRHSHAGREPRPTHVANDGKEFDVREGWLDPAINKRIWPGTEINCRCFSSPVLPR